MFQRDFYKMAIVSAVFCDIMKTSSLATPLYILPYTKDPGVNPKVFFPFPPLVSLRQPKPYS